MRRILTITLSALMLASCASGYDKTAVTGATVSMALASKQCQAKRAANDLKTYSELEACELAAERAFAIAIHMKKMETFEEYANRMQALAADRDANRVTAQQVKLQADAIRSRFLADCNCKPKTASRLADNYMPGEGHGTDMGMGEGNHAMGPGPQP